MISMTAEWVAQINARHPTKPIVRLLMCWCRICVRMGAVSLGNCVICNSWAREWMLMYSVGKLLMMIKVLLEGMFVQLPIIVLLSNISDRRINYWSIVYPLVTWSHCGNRGRTYRLDS